MTLKIYPIVLQLVRRQLVAAGVGLDRARWDHGKEQQRTRRERRTEEFMAYEIQSKSPPRREVAAVKSRASAAEIPTRCPMRSAQSSATSGAWELPGRVQR
jgi:hypothetical protein